MLKDSETIMTLNLDSGLIITLSDETRHYFGGYYHIKVLAHCNVPLVRDYFDDETQYLDACKKLGDYVRFERILEKMAVPEDEIISVRNQLVGAFTETATRYLSAPDFDRLLVRKEYRIRQGKSLNKYTSRVLS